MEGKNSEKFDSSKHKVLDLLYNEYYYFERGYLKEEIESTDENFRNFKEGISLEDQGFGFLSEENLIVYEGEQKEFKERNYFIVCPDKRVFSTKGLENLKGLKFGDSDSILKHTAARYWDICKSLLDETAYERAGSF